MHTVCKQCMAKCHIGSLIRSVEFICLISYCVVCSLSVVWSHGTLRSTVQLIELPETYIFHLLNSLVSQNLLYRAGNTSVSSQGSTAACLPSSNPFLFPSTGIQWYQAIELYILTILRTAQHSSPNGFHSKVSCRWQTMLDPEGPCQAKATGRCTETFWSLLAR